MPLQDEVLPEEIDVALGDLIERFRDPGEEHPRDVGVLLDGARAAILGSQAPDELIDDPLRGKPAPGSSATGARAGRDAARGIDPARGSRASAAEPIVGAYVPVRLIIVCAQWHTPARRSGPERRSLLK